MLQNKFSWYVIMFSPYVFSSKNVWGHVKDTTHVHSQEKNYAPIWLFMEHFLSFYIGHIKFYFLPKTYERIKNVGMYVWSLLSNFSDTFKFRALFRIGTYALESRNTTTIFESIIYFFDMKHLYSIKTRLNRRPLDELQVQGSSSPTCKVHHGLP
jgi:hypothetical protein